MGRREDKLGLRITGQIKRSTGLRADQFEVNVKPKTNEVIVGGAVFRDPSPKGVVAKVAAFFRLKDE